MSQCPTWVAQSSRQKGRWEKGSQPTVVQKSTPDWEIDEFTRKLPATDPDMRVQLSALYLHSASEQTSLILPHSCIDSRYPLPSVYHIKYSPLSHTEGKRRRYVPQVNGLATG